MIANWMLGKAYVIPLCSNLDCYSDYTFRAIFNFISYSAEIFSSSVF